MSRTTQQSGEAVGFGAVRVDYIQTPSPPAWEMKLAERALWAGSLSELFTRIGQSD